MYKLLSGFLISCLLVISCSGDTGGMAGSEEAKPSTKSMVMQTIGTTDVTVEYHSPAKRDRVIFGELVPYGEPWRAGANEATTIEFSKAVRVQGEQLDAGKYGFWVIPDDSGEWTLIFSSANDVWGATYPEGQDALRVTAQASQREPRERLEYYFSRAAEQEGVLLLTWDTIRLPIAIETLENDEEVMPSLKAAVMNTIMTTEVTVHYHRPAVRGRTIFGELVPFDEVWRTGANNATTIEFSKDVTLNGQPLAAGKYGFWLIPIEEGPATLIFSSDADVPGTPYPEGNDVLRIDVEPVTGEETEELLEYVFPGTTTNTGQLHLVWDTWRFPMTITVQ